MESKPMKLVLIEDDVCDCNVFKELAINRTDIKFVGITDSDIDGLKLVQQFKPDGIILDLELNKGKGSGNGFNFLEEVKKLKLPIKPQIVVTTNVCSDTVYDFVHKNGVDLIFYKKQENYSAKNVLNTLLLLRGYKSFSNNELQSALNVNCEAEISNKIDNELDLIGIGTHLQGRKYLYDAIKYIIENEDSNVTVIQALVSKYKKSNSTISRAMQNAILHAWRISSLEDLSINYTAKINYETGIPTPTELIYYYADKIKKSI